MTPEENVHESSRQLAVSARAFARTGDAQSWGDLCQAAETFAKARWAMKAPAPKPGAAGGHVIPFGRNKGQALSEADEKDLRYVAGAMKESIADPNKSKWAAKNQELLDACEAELATR